MVINIFQLNKYIYLLNFYNFLKFTSIGFGTHDKTIYLLWRRATALNLTPHT